MQNLEPQVSHLSHLPLTRRDLRASIFRRLREATLFIQLLVQFESVWWGQQAGFQFLASQQCGDCFTGITFLEFSLSYEEG